ncbi:MAG: glycosyltransferase family 2 protein [Caulobacteraceae bacterium]|nr:glycosyltransferase family 2 protein [Caulobacter sp.]
MNTHIRPLSGGLVATAWHADARLDVGVTVVMVVYRTGPVLAKSVRRVLREEMVDELVLIDNGSTDDEEAILDEAAREPKVTLIRGHGNVGFARGANMGASAAHGRVLVFLNPDALLQAGCVSALKNALTVQVRPCLIGARVLNPDGSEQRGARRGEVTPVTTLLSLTRLSQRMKAFRGFEIHHEADPTPGEPLAVPTISGACFAMTRADFADMGGFDTGYFLHVEDVDLCWRVRRSGGDVLFQPAARVTHLGSTSRSHPLKVEFHKGVGLARYFRKRADTPQRQVLAWGLSLPIIGVSVLRALRRRRPAHA